MKRTTYIIFGMLLVGLVVMSGIIFFQSTNARWENSFMEVGGELKTTQLPACKVVEYKVKDRGRDVNFRELKLRVCSADSAAGSFSYADGMDKYMAQELHGDTLRFIFDFPKEGLDKKYQDMILLNLRSSEMVLSLPAGVQRLKSGIKGMETTFEGLRCDTLSFSIKNLAVVKDCHITSLAAQAQTLHLNSGEIQNLYLDLDDVHNWRIDAEHMKVDVEHLTGSGNNESTVVKDECREILWTPKNERVELKLVLKQAAKINLAH